MSGLLVPACKRCSPKRPAMSLARSLSSSTTHGNTSALLTWSTAESRHRHATTTVAAASPPFFPRAPLRTACTSPGASAWMPLLSSTATNNIRHTRQQQLSMLQTSTTRFTSAASAAQPVITAARSTAKKAHQHKRPKIRLDASFLAMSRHRLSQKFGDSFHFDYCKDKPIREAAVFMPLCVVKGVPSVLFTVRGNNMRNHRGECSFPGGKRDPEDPTILSTALREMNEEVSISPEDVEVLGEYAAMPNKDCTMRVTPFVGYLRKPLEDVSTIVYNKDEVQRVFTVPIDDLLDPAKKTMVRFRDSKYMYPVWHVQDGLTIWGLTAFILDGVLRTIAAEGPLGSTVIPEGSTLERFKPPRSSAFV